MARTYGTGIRAVDTSTASVTKTVVLPADVPATATIVLGILNRTGGTPTLVGISDPVNGAWNLVTTEIVPQLGSPTTGWVHALTNSAALSGAGNRTITVETSVGLSTQLVAMYIVDDVATLVRDAVGTTLTNGSNQTNWDTTPFAVADAGALVGVLLVSNAQASAPTADGAGETNRTTTSDPGSFRSTIFTQDVTAAGSEGMEATCATSTTGHFVTFSVTVSAGADPPPTITSIDGDDSLAYDDVAVPIVGTDFDTATVTFEQTGGVSVSQTIGSQNATTITLSRVTGFATGGALKNGSATVRVTNGDAQDDTHAFTITPPPFGDISYVDLSTAAVGGQKLTAIPTLASGDQVEWTNVIGVSGYVSTDVTVYADHTVSWVNGVSGFDVRYYDNTAKEWSAWVTQTIDAITAAAQTGAGSSRRRRQGKQRYFVEVDGQEFVVDTAQQAQALLERARALAENEAEKATDETVTKLSKKSRIPEVRISAPEIKVSPELQQDLSPLIADIKRLYEKAAMNAELRLRLERALQEEEDELLLLL